MRLYSFTPLPAALVSLAMAACQASAPAGGASAANPAAVDAGGEQPWRPLAQAPFAAVEVASFAEPWAMAFLPDGRHALVTQKSGQLKYWQAGGTVADVAGVPEVAYGGQGGLGDVILSPDFAASGTVYLSWVEAGPGRTYGAVVGRATLDHSGAPALRDLHIIWKQQPKVSGRGHFSHRLVFSPDGQSLFIASGERQHFDPAQDMGQNLGKIVRLNPDGSIPADNPFADRGGVTAQIWTLGHRNLLGLAFDGEGRFWEQEMGPRGGDEVNLIVRGDNYGYPVVSNGNHYDGRDIPDHPTHPEFHAPALWWNPSISPAGLAWYGGDRYPGWTNSLMLGALSGKGLIRVQIDGDTLHKADYWDFGTRIREVEVAPDGIVYLLTDGPGGRLLRLDPKR